MGHGRANICKKCITTNKNVFASSLELLILVKVEKTKRHSWYKSYKTSNLINGVVLHFIGFSWKKRAVTRRGHYFYFLYSEKSTTLHLNMIQMWMQLIFFELFWEKYTTYWITAFLWSCQKNFRQCSWNQKFFAIKSKCYIS